jgi:hypothetical protein
LNETRPEDSGRVSFNIARLVESSIHPVVGPIYGSVSGQVNALALDRRGVFAGGHFRAAGQTVVSNIARWDSATRAWHPLGRGVNGDVHAMVVHGDSLVVGGSFDSADGIPVRHIACWDLTRERWFPMDTGIGVVVRALGSDGSLLYAAGFDRVVSRPFSTTSPGAVAQWNGRSWAQLGTSRFDQGISALTVNQGQLYVTGSFRKIGDDTTMQFVARWDGTAWNAIGYPIATFKPQVNSRAIAVHDGDIYIGGFYYFTAYGSADRYMLVRWRAETENWEMTPIVAGWHTVFSLLSTSDGLYVGGQFDLDSGQEWVSSIVRIEGGEILPLSSGLSTPLYGNDSLDRTPGIVSSLAFDGSHLYAGGLFHMADDIPSVNLARWKEPEPRIDITLDPRTLDFGTVPIGESKELSFVISNDSTSTTFLRGSVDSSIGMMSVVAGAGEYILAPGSSRVVRVRFAPTATVTVSEQIAGGHNATNEATAAVRLLASSGSSDVAVDDRPVGILSLICSPNPATTHATISFLPARNGDARVHIENALGENLATLIDAVGRAGEQRVEWDLSGVSAGLYMVVLESGGERRSMPIVVAR